MFLQRVCCYGSPVGSPTLEPRLSLSSPTGDQLLAQVRSSLVRVGWPGSRSGAQRRLPTGTERPQLKRLAYLMESEEKEMRPLSKIPAGVSQVDVPLTFWRDHMQTGVPEKPFQLHPLPKGQCVGCSFA